MQYIEHLFKMCKIGKKIRGTDPQGIKNRQKA